MSKNGSTADADELVIFVEKIDAAEWELE